MGGKASRYDHLSVGQLRKRATDVGIQGRSSMKKPELVTALRSH